MPWQGGQNFSDKNYLKNFILGQKIFILGQKLTENFYPRTKVSENFILGQNFLRIFILG